MAPRSGLHGYVLIFTMLTASHSRAQGDPVDLNGTAMSFSTCYQDNMDSLMTWYDNGPGPVEIKFCAGQMEECCDVIEIYDGLNDLAPLLYVGNGNSGDLTGLFVASSNADHGLSLRIRSNETFNCQSGWYVPIEWVVYAVSLGNPECVFLGTEAVDDPSRVGIWPNPADDVLHLWSSAVGSGSRIELRDLSGRMVQVGVRTSAIGWELDTHALASGEYFVTISGFDQVVTLKALVLH